MASVGYISEMAGRGPARDSTLSGLSGAVGSEAAVQAALGVDSIVGYIVTIFRSKGIYIGSVARGG